MKLSKRARERYRERARQRKRVSIPTDFVGLAVKILLSYVNVAELGKKKGVEETYLLSAALNFDFSEFIIGELKNE